jgi:hypothetical protein
MSSTDAWLTDVFTLCGASGEGAVGSAWSNVKGRIRVESIASAVTF